MAAWNEAKSLSVPCQFQLTRIPNSKSKVWEESKGKRVCSPLSFSTSDENLHKARVTEATFDQTHPIKQAETDEDKQLKVVIGGIGLSWQDHSWPTVKKMPCSTQPALEVADSNTCSVDFALLSLPNHHLGGLHLVLLFHAAHIMTSL